MRFYRSPVKRSVQFAAVLSAIVFCAGDVAALGLGELSVRSHLGARFLAKVQLIENIGDKRLSESCFRLGNSEEGDNGVPSLTSGYLRIERQGDLSTLIITSAQTINDPILQVNLHAGCGAELVRRYTVLIDPEISQEPAKQAIVSSPVAHGSSESEKSPPPTASASDHPKVWRIVEGESAKSIIEALFTHQPKAQRRFLRALRAENSQLDLGERGDKPLDAGTLLTIPDTRHLPTISSTDTGEQPIQVSEKPKSSPGSSSRKIDSGQKPAGHMSDRLVISGNIDENVSDSELSLRPSTDLSTHLSDKISESNRALLRVEYRLLNSLYVQAEQQLAVAEQIRDLEASFEALRIATENADRHTEGAAAPTDTKPAKAPVTVTPKTPEPKREGSSVWWLEILIILGLIGALTWALSRSSGKRAPPLSPINEKIVPDFPAPNTLSLDDEDRFEPPLFTKTSSTVSALPINELAASALPEPTDEKQDVQFRHIELDGAGDYNTVMELAEIMVSFGRIKGATQALEEFLEHDPGVALEPWLKLLEIYRANDMRTEFEACSARLKMHFNVSSGTWESAGESIKEPITVINEADLSIETLFEKLPIIVAMPYLKKCVQMAWDSPDGLVNLKRLLIDTRNGARNGFPLPIARELLFLIELLGNRWKNKA